MIPSIATKSPARLLCSRNLFCKHRPPLQSRFWMSSPEHLERKKLRNPKVHLTLLDAVPRERVALQVLLERQKLRNPKVHLTSLEAVPQARVALLVQVLHITFPPPKLLRQLGHTVRPMPRVLTSIRWSR